MKTTLAKLLDIVALLEDKPATGLVAGQVGTIVEVLALGVFEVESCDLAGNTIGFAELCRHEFPLTRYLAAKR